jgi:hypothetical protein
MTPFPSPAIINTSQPYPITVIATELPDWASGGIDLIGGEARRLFTGLEVDEGDRKVD